MELGDFAAFGAGVVALVALLAFSRKARRILREAVSHPFGQPPTRAATADAREYAQAAHR
jgi:hypothetical protein